MTAIYFRLSLKMMETNQWPIESMCWEKAIFISSWLHWNFVFLSRYWQFTGRGFIWQWWFVFSFSYLFNCIVILSCTTHSCWMMLWKHVCQLASILALHHTPRRYWAITFIIVRKLIFQFFQPNQLFEVESSIFKVEWKWNCWILIFALLD